MAVLYNNEPVTLGNSIHNLILFNPTLLLVSSTFAAALLKTILLIFCEEKNILSFMKNSPQITPADYNNAWLSRTIPMNHPRGFEGCRCKFHTDHRVLKARILKWFAITFSSGAHSIGTLHHDPPILGGPIGHGLVSLS